MSRENVEVVKGIFDAIADRDASRVRALYDSEVEVDSSRLPEASLEGGGLAQGYEGIRSAFRDWSQAWESFEDHCDEVIDAGEYVVSLVTRRGRGRASGVEAVTPRAGVWTIRDGKVIRVVWFPTHEEALEAVGLRE
jgi:ketosteroid isomerase-like protein